jgi:hypothetical protein
VRGRRAVCGARYIPAVTHLDDEIQDALITSERADARLRRAWERRIDDPKELSRALREYNSAGQWLTELMNQHFRGETGE